MNREDIIRMAREQGLPETATEGVFIVNTDDLGRILAAEREACAKVCENMAKGYEERSARPEKDRDINPDVARIAIMTCGFVEAAIRARGNT